LNDRLLITITWGANDVVSYLEEKLKNIAHNRLVDTFALQQFIIKLFLFTAKMYLRHLKEIYHDLQIPLSEHTIPTFNEDIVSLLKIEQSLVYFDASLRSNYIVLEKIARRKQFTETENDRELLEDAEHESRQAVEVVKVYGHIVEDVQSALSSLISNNLTRTVNWLTKVTIVLMVPTLVATLYGMNVPLPFAHSNYAFSITIGISLVVTLFVIVWLNRYSKRRVPSRLSELPRKKRPTAMN
jgi:magnesium transporter